MELTEEEKWSLTMAESERTYKVRMVYFAMLRCADCTERRSCDPHMMEMAGLSK